MNIIIQTSVPSYRLNFYKHLVNNCKQLKIISGDEFYTPTVKSDKNTPNVIWIKNLFFFKRKFLYQKLPWQKILKADNVVVEFNLRNISFYIVFFLRLIMLKNCYLWGHAWSRKGEKSNSEIVRFLFKKFSSGYITYTQKQKYELQKQLKNKNIFAACNSIYYSNEMTPIIAEFKNITNFIYVGRLVKEKKVFILLKAFHKIIDDLPENVRLVIVGDGVEYKMLNDYVKKNNLSNRILILGEISDYEKLKELYSTSIASVSPGYVGLSITQSLGFGVPMIISKKEPHSPEIEAVTEHNSIFFETDNILDLGDKLISFVINKEEWLLKRELISEDCKQKYSIEKMTSPFIKIFKND